MKNPVKLFVLLLFVLSACSAQQKVDHKFDCIQEYDSTLNQKVYAIVDEMPQYLNGEQDLLRFFVSNFRYPEEQEDIQRTIKLAFIIGTSGQIEKSAICNKSRKEFTLVDKEALRVLSIMPKWKPGKCNGIEVPVRVLWPIRF